MCVYVCVCAIVSILVLHYHKFVCKWYILVFVDPSVERVMFKSQPGKNTSFQISAPPVNSAKICSLTTHCRWEDEASGGKIRFGLISPSSSGRALATHPHKPRQNKLKPQTLHTDGYL